MNHLSIAEQIVGPIPDKWDDAALAQRVVDNYTQLTGHEPGSYEALYSYIDSLDAKARTAGWGAIRRFEDERASTFFGLAEIVTGEAPTLATPYTSWVNNQTTIDKLGYTGGDTALLIGALSPLSAHIFKVFASNVLKVEHPLVVDIAGTKEMGKAGQFILGSGLSLPLRSDSVDFVVTDQLLHMLEDPSSSAKCSDSLTASLVSEIGRVLSPRGQVLMKEYVNREHCKDRDDIVKKTEDLGEQLVGLMQHNGIHHAEHSPVIVPIFWDDMTDPSFDPLHPYASVAAKHDVVSIYGRKSI